MFGGGGGPIGKRDDSTSQHGHGTYSVLDSILCL